MKIKSPILITVTVLLFAIVFFWVISGKPKLQLGGILELVPGVNYFADETEETPEETPEETKDLIAYVHPENKFSFKHPAGLKIASNKPDDFQEIITVEKDAQTGFQIFLTPFDEAGPITPERIKRDLPDIEMAGIQYARLGGADAVLFRSNYEGLDTYEVWVIHADRLYQIITYKGL